MKKSLLYCLKLSAAISLVSFLLFLLLNFVFPLRDRIEYSTIVLDGKHEVIHAFLTTDEKWRMKTTLDEISSTLKKTLIFKEDKYFFYHPGVNPIAVLRAMVMNVLHLKRTSGASTLTMQVARMLEPKRRTYLNKFIEVFRAFQLEWKYSKQEILQLYFNLVPYGSNIEGVKSASVLFFAKNPDHLSLSEVTALSIIPNRPSTLQIGKNNDYIVLERNKWLNRFMSENLFSKKEISDALDEPLTARRMDAPRHAPHLAQKLKRKLRSSVVSTHLVMNTQKKVEQLTYDYVKNLYNINIRNAAVVIIDNRTHRVITYVGSADFNDKRDGGQVNGADAVRQPGSALKPLIYGLCFDNGLLTPKTMVTDVATNFGGFMPENYDQKFHGYVSVEFALENSLNIPAVKALNVLGTSSLTAKLKQCRFRQISIDEKKLGLSVALGGCGVTLEEMTGLYSAFANEGIFVQPELYEKDNLYNSIPQVSSSTKEKTDSVSAQVTLLSPSANFMITEILSRLARPDLPVNWEASMHTPRIAWKTGTSFGRRDAWSIGYNKNYTVGVWVGNFSGVGVPELNGANIATPLLFKIFNTIDYNSANDWYAMPKECGIRTVCSETGKLPAEYCKNLVADYFIPLVSPNLQCDNMKEVCVTANEQFSYCKNCLPVNGYKKKVFRIIAPEIQSYYDDNRIAYQAFPKHNPTCEKLFAEGAPSIRFPTNGTEYFISKTEPEDLQLSCEVSGDVQFVYWYINNKFYRKSDARKKEFFTPAEGATKISCTDDKGRNTDVWIKVKFVSL